MTLPTIARSVLSLTIAICGGYAAAGPVGIDGVIGSEWNGVSVVNVTHDANAPENNFSNPGPTTTGASYNIRVRGDGSYVYVALQVTGSAAFSAGNFANLYFDTNPPAADGSDVGFEVTNNRYFIAGDPSGTYYDASKYLTYDASHSGTIELAIDDAFFTSGPQAGLPFPLGYPAADGDVVLRLSQSFGYSVAGGPSYGPNRLGSASVLATDATVPEPASIALALAALASAAVVRRPGTAKKSAHLG